jgi:hypothetical protein
MNTKMILSAVVSLLLVLPGYADDLIPATSDDITDFDQQVSTQVESESRSVGLREEAKHADKAQKSKDKKVRKENFGLIVSTEAKRLNEESGDKKKEMGKWVSEQRRQNAKSSGGSSAGSNAGGVTNASSADAKNAAPGLNGDAASSRGNNGQGKSGSNKK